MCGILLAVLLAALVAPPARADDPTPRCIARKLGAAGKAVARLAACHARAARRGTAVDAGCTEGAERRFAEVYAHVESGLMGRICLDDDGLPRVQAVIAGVIEEAARRLAPAAGASRCEAGKLRAAGGRATATLRANARALPRPTPPRPPHVRAKRRAPALESARPRFGGS